MNDPEEFIERHDVMVVLAANEEPVPAVATVTWEAPAPSSFITVSQ